MSMHNVRWTSAKCREEQCFLGLLVALVRSVKKFRVSSHEVPSPKSPLMLASPNMQTKPQIVSLKKSLEYSRDLCWELGLAFCSTQLSTQVPGPHLLKVLPCEHPCRHTWDSWLGTYVQLYVPTPLLSTAEIVRINLKWLGTWDLGPRANRPLVSPSQIPRPR